MRKTKYPVKLSEKERQDLLHFVKYGNSNAQEITRANILLALDENHGIPLKQREISERYHVSNVTIYHTISQYASQGIYGAIKRKVRETPAIPRKVTGDLEARLIALACSTPPEGRSRWTLVLLQEEAIRIGLVEYIAPETIRRALKKRIKTTSEETVGDTTKRK